MANDSEKNTFNQYNGNINIGGNQTVNGNTHVYQRGTNSTPDPGASPPAHKISNETYRRILNLITPHMQEEKTRRSVVYSAFFGLDLVDQIDWTGDARGFTSALIVKLLYYGKTESGRYAVVNLLEEMRSRVGTGGQAEIDTLIAKIED